MSKMTIMYVCFAITFNKPATMDIAIINFKEAAASSVYIPFDIFSKTGDIVKYWGNIKSKTNFSVNILDFDVLKKDKKLFTRRYNLIVLPSIGILNIEQTINRNQKLITWIKKQYNSGAQIATLCSGTFLLAETGLLDGRKATTNWMTAAAFKQRYPKVLLEDDKIIIDSKNIYTCGAGYSSLSFILYLIEKFAGHAVAVAVSKALLIQMMEANQHAFSIFNAQRNHGDNQIIKVQEFIERNYDKELQISDIAERFNISNRTLIRRFNAATGNTPLEYIQRVKVESAKKLLENKSTTVEQVCYKTGYKDVNFFRMMFKRHTGMSPLDYRKNFQYS